MCFSAQASFAAGAALLPAGAYCMSSALRKSPRMALLAFIPLAFSVQQLAEGLVWRGLEEGNSLLVQNASVLFLFFAIVFWPLWIPLSLIPLARGRKSGAILAALTVISLAWLWLYYPLATDPGRWLTTRIDHHSIRYEYDDLPGFQVTPHQIWRMAYLLSICLPLIVCRRGGSGGKLSILGGLLVAGLFLMSYLVFWYAFTSVWCFFAAILSLVLCGVFYQLPQTTRAQGAS
ncbi:MAG: DUF6629 family protein [Gemmataceae bacterium]